MQMTETTVMNFDDALKNISAVVNNIGRKRENMFTEKLPRFITSCSKFLNTYNKVKDESESVENLKSRFYNVFRAHKSEILDDIFDENGTLNDDWLRDDSLPDEKSSRKKKNRISTEDIRYRGVVVYIDEDNMMLRNICIPLHEIYSETERIYQNLKKNKELCLLPHQFIQAILYCFYFCISEDKFDARIKIMNNIQKLQQFISAGSSEEAESNGTVFGNLEKVISKFTNGDKKIDTSKLTSIVDGVIAPENKEKLSQAFSAVTQKVQEKGDLIEGLKESMDTPEMGELFNKGKQLLSSATSFIRDNFVGENANKISEQPDIPAAEQE